MTDKKLPVEATKVDFSQVMDIVQGILQSECMMTTVCGREPSAFFVEGRSKWKPFEKVAVGSMETEKHHLIQAALSSTESKKPNLPKQWELISLDGHPVLMIRQELPAKATEFYAHNLVPCVSYAFHYRTENPNDPISCGSFCEHLLSTFRWIESKMKE